MYNQNWCDKTQVLKGDFAENIIHTFLEEKGFIVYKPETNGAHGFDRLAVKNKKELMIAEVKAKARMKKYKCTGIDVRHFKEYKLVQEKHKIPVWIFFVDEWLGKIYGNWLSKLENNVTDTDGITYPNYSIAKGIVLFSMDNMINIRELTKEDISYLKEHSTRSYDY